MAIQGSKTVTTSGTQVQLLPATTETLERCCARLTITANAANTNNIYVGDSTVSTTAYGVLLDAGQSVTLGMGETIGNSTDLSNVWIDADTNGEGVKFYGEQI